MARKKDSANSAADWHRALALIDEAIRIRDSAHEQGWRDYELARSLCQIHLDPDFNHSPQLPSDAAQARLIRAGLDQSKNKSTSDEARNIASRTDQELIAELGAPESPLSVRPRRSGFPQLAAFIYHSIKAKKA